MLIKIHVKTSAKKESLKKRGPDLFEINVREPAEDNMANKRILGIMHATYPDATIKLIKGHHSPHKIVDVGHR